MGEENKTFNLPINKHLDSFVGKLESGVIPGSDYFDSLTRTVDTTAWDGRRMTFNIDNLSLDRLIVGSKCFLEFRCTASKADNSPIVIADPIELKEEAGNILIQQITTKIAGTEVHNTGNADLNRHWYERIANTNTNRMAQNEQDRYIDADSVAFGILPNTMLRTGIRDSAITDGKQFTITRPLTEIAFFGPRDSAIPAALPVRFDLVLESRTGKVFNTDDTIILAPKLNIIDVTLWVYTLALEPAASESLKEALRVGTLSGSADKWNAESFGNTVVSGATTFRSSDSTILEATPDVLGVFFIPSSTLVSATPWKGVHPFTTTWLNIDKIDIRTFGTVWRSWGELGVALDVGRKGQMVRELSEMTGAGHIAGLGRSPIDTTVFAKGAMSFFPVSSRSVTEETIMDPVPVSITTTGTMKTSAGQDAQGYYFYKLRHQWQLSSISGNFRIIK